MEIEAVNKSEVTLRSVSKVSNNSSDQSLDPVHYQAKHVTLGHTSSASACRQFTSVHSPSQLKHKQLSLFKVVKAVFRNRDEGW